jgi:hypothetical protein
MLHESLIGRIAMACHVDINLRTGKPMAQTGFAPGAKPPIVPA